ncbi:MAG TPA: hypothetical protein VM555_04640 [Tahibacter sp.]|nr:hypothetical protein [Tahibacter sp.]
MTTFRSIVAILVLAFGAAAPARAIVGYPDPSFGSGGAQWVRLGDQEGYEYLQAVAALPDGRIVVMGNPYPSSEIGVARRLPDGAPDPSFGNGLGKFVVTAAAHGYDGYFAGYAMALQPDGKIVVAGRFGPGIVGPAEANRFLVLRVLADGSALDRSFGDHGIVMLPMTAYGADNHARAVVVQPDGKILVAGAELDQPNDSDMLVMRLLSNGAPDDTFGSHGRRTIGFDFTGTAARRHDVARTLALQPDGKIVVAGASHTAAEGSYAAVARLTADGNLDPLFGTYATGRTRFRFGSNDINVVFASAFSSLPTDTQHNSWRIVLAGWTHLTQGDSSFAVAVLDDAGKLDPTFDDDGKLAIMFNAPSDHTYAQDDAQAVAIESGWRRVASPLGGSLVVPYRKIIVAGNSHRGTYQAAALARVGFDGALDDSFGFGGKSVYSPQYSAGGVPFYCHTQSHSIAKQGARLIVGSSCGAAGSPDAVSIGRILLQQ